MIISYKIRVYPSKRQEYIINRTCGACRWVYNRYLGYNKKIYEEEKRFVSGYEFSKILTQLKKTEPDYMWLKEISSKAIHESFMNADEAIRRFFKGKTGFPHFKSKKSPVQSYYFVGDKVRFVDNKVVLPILGKVRITENDYVPKNKRVIGGTIKKELDKYYAIFRIDMDKEELDKSPYDNHYNGYGIDVGIKSYLSISDKMYNIYQFPSFLKDKRILKLEEKVAYLQRLISSKMEINYGKLLNDYLNKYHNEPNIITKNIMKGESYSNTCKYLQNKISKLKKKISNIKTDIINKIIIKMVKTKPKYITIETLDISSMLKNNSSTDIHRYIQDSQFYTFFQKLIFKCKIYGIELRKANKYFASSKKCCVCGNKKKDLKLSDRIYKCECCGNELDRDVNASLNLVNLKKYSLV